MVSSTFPYGYRTEVLPEDIMFRYDAMTPVQFLDNLEAICDGEREVAARYLEELDGWRREQVVMIAEKRGAF
jgi:hypothetical protein